jgi:hypothetical protein
MRLMVACAAQHTQPLVQPTDSGLEALRAEGKRLGKAALAAAASGLMPVVSRCGRLPRRLARGGRRGREKRESNGDRQEEPTAPGLGQNGRSSPRPSAELTSTARGATSR